MSDEAEVLKLDEAWNEAYRQHDHSGLAAVLADDFTALTAVGEPVTKASLMVHPPGRAQSVTRGVRLPPSSIRAFWMRLIRTSAFLRGVTCERGTVSRRGTAEIRFNLIHRTRAFP